MHTALTYEVQKVILAERRDRASRSPLPELPQPHWHRRRGPGRLARDLGGVRWRLLKIH
jgi:hypothetical protein